MENPYASYFEKLDETLAVLDGFKDDGSIIEGTCRDAANLLRRAGFVLANLLSVNALVLPTLVLAPEDEPQSADSSPSDTT